MRWTFSQRTKKSVVSKYIYIYFEYGVYAYVKDISSKIWIHNDQFDGFVYNKEPELSVKDPFNEWPILHQSQGGYPVHCYRFLPLV